MQLIEGTAVPDSETNRNIIATVELYRQRLTEKNVEGLLVLASDRYFEDSGTPRAADDYGYSGLKERLLRTLGRAKSIRYEIKYRNIRMDGQRAEVQVHISGAFELATESGDERYRRVSDYHRFLLERTENDKWKFLAGM